MFLVVRNKRNNTLDVIRTPQLDLKLHDVLHYPDNGTTVQFYTEEEAKEYRDILSVVNFFPEWNLPESEI